jgi:hypothetical protein
VVHDDGDVELIGLVDDHRHFAEQPLGSAA